MVKGYTTKRILRAQEGASFEDIESGDAFETAYIVYAPDGSIVWDTTDYSVVSQYFSDDMIDEDYECVPNKSNWIPTQELCVNTTNGKLKVMTGHDPKYPEYYIVLETPQGIEFTLANIGQEENSIKMRFKDFLPCEDFTNTIEFTKEYITEATQEEEDY